MQVPQDPGTPSQVLLNDVNLIELVLHPPVFKQVMGCLEYDPELKFKPDFRDFLSSQANFREVIPMDAAAVADLRDKIQFNFRAGFLRDVMMRPGMDDSALTTLTSYIFFNSSEILNRLHQDSDYLKRLVEVVITEPNTGTGTGTGASSASSSSGTSASADGSSSAAAAEDHDRSALLPGGSGSLPRFNLIFLSRHPFPLFPSLSRPFPPCQMEPLSPRSAAIPQRDVQHGEERADPEPGRTLPLPHSRNLSLRGGHGRPWRQADIRRRTALLHRGHPSFLACDLLALALALPRMAVDACVILAWRMNCGPSCVCRSVRLCFRPSIWILTSVLGYLYLDADTWMSRCCRVW